MTSCSHKDQKENFLRLLTNFFDPAKNKHFSRYVIYFLLIFIALYGLTSMRRFPDVIITLRHDNPIAWAQFYLSPYLMEGYYINDQPAEALVNLKVSTSLANGIPVWLGRFLGIPPYTTTWILSLISGSMFGISIFVFARSVGLLPVTSILASIFSYAAAPWAWQAAGYNSTLADWNYYPYPGFWVIPPLILSFKYLVQNKLISAIGLLILAGLIHPSITVAAAAIFGLYWLFEAGSNRAWKQLLTRYAVLLIACVLFMLPTLLINLGISKDTIPRQELITGLNLNTHIRRWQNPWSATELFRALALSLFALHGWASFAPPYRRLWLAGWVCALVFGISHVLGGLLQIPQLLQLIGLRILIFPAIISIPLIMKYLEHHIQQGNWSGISAALACLALPLFAGRFGFFLPPILCLLLLDISKEEIGVWRFSPSHRTRQILETASVLLLVAWGFSFFTYPLESSTLPFGLANTVNLLADWPRIDFPLSSLKRAFVLAAIALCALFFRYLYQRLPRDEHSAQTDTVNWRFSLTLAILITAYSISFLMVRWQPGNDYTQNDRYMTQIWIRENTPREAVIFTPLFGFETFPERRIMSAYIRPDYAYTGLKATVEYRHRVMQFYGYSYDDVKYRGIAGIRDVINQNLASFRADDYQKLNKEFGVTYVLLENTAKNARLELPKIYESKGYILYSLNLDMP